MVCLLLTDKKYVINATTQTHFEVFTIHSIYNYFNDYYISCLLVGRGVNTANMFFCNFPTIGSPLLPKVYAVPCVMKSALWNSLQSCFNLLVSFWMTKLRGW